MKKQVQLTLLYIFAVSIALSAQYQGTTPYVHENGGLIINEVSQGQRGGRAEYIEFVVVGSGANPTGAVNLEGWIIDDNNFPGNNQGTAPGHSSFGSCFSAVPPGSIIVFYNADDKNPTIPADDPLDNNPADGVYIVSHKDACINTCNSNPVPPMLPDQANPTYCPCIDPAAERDLWALGMSNTTDLVQVRDRCEVVQHVLYWDDNRDIRIVDDIENSPVKVKIEGSQQERVLRLMNTVDFDWTKLENYDNPSFQGNETPGAANSPENQTFINSLQTGNFQPNGIIYNCKDTDAGDLIPPTDAGTEMPIEITVGEDIGGFGANYDKTDEDVPNALGFTFEYAYILTQNDAPTFTIIDFNLDGDFDFSQYPVGEYLVWGFSYIQTNGTVRVSRYLANVVESIADILNYEECGFDANLDNLTADGQVVQVNINEVECFELVGRVTPNACENTQTGAININVKNFSPPLNIQWNESRFDGQLAIRDLSPGEYQVTVTDSSGCVTADTFQIITEHELPTATFQTTSTICDEDCLDVEINCVGIPPFVAGFEVQAGMTTIPIELTIFQSDTIFEICPPASNPNRFTLRLNTIQDANCSDGVTQSSTIDILEAVIADFSAKICANESITVNGTLYDATRLSGTEIIPNGSLNGCDSIIPIALTVLPLDTFFLQQAICSAEQITVNGTVYDQTRLAGIEVLNGASFTGCDSVVVIDLMPRATPEEGIFQQQLCAGESLEFNGTTYDADNPTGTELLVGQARNGCDSVVNVTVTFFELAEGAINTNICEATTFEFNGTIYDEDNTSGVELLPNAAFNGCDSIVNVSVTINPLARSTFQDTLCVGDELRINGNAYTAANPSGIERFTRPDACDSLVTVELLFSPIPMASIEGNASICDGDSATLIFRFSEVGSYDLVYSANGTLQELEGVQDGDAIAFSPSETTTYTLVSVENPLYPCVEMESTATIQVSDLKTTIVKQDESCIGANDGQIQIEVLDEVPPVQVDWANQTANSLTLDQLAPGTYTATISDAGGCITEKQIQIDTGTVLNYSESIRFPDCATDPLAMVAIDSIFGGTNPYFVTLDRTTQSYTNFPLTFRNTRVGRYELLIEDAAGCQRIETIDVPQPTILNVELGEDITLQLGDSVLMTPAVTGEVVAAQWLSEDNSWRSDSLAAYLAPRRTTVYQIQIEDEQGCTTTDQITIYVVNDESIVLPNAFSPNGDSVNDFFELYPNPSIASILSFQVFDRWGNLVFQQQDTPTLSWNGQFDGQAAPSGTYAYRIEALMVDGRTILLTGTLDLL